MFGAKGGPTIRNKDSILADVDRALGREKPPAIEYLFVAPFGSFEIFGIKFGSPYGHSAIRYTLPDGTQVVMNIVKNSEDEDKLVNFVDPTEYLYGTQFDDVGAEQGGAYNRQIVGVRIEEWPDDLVCDLHYYYSKMARRETKKNAKFSLILGPFYNFLRSRMPEGVSWAESGNCARWTSQGMVFADALSYAHVWPKQIWINLFEKLGAANRDNVNVVLYQHIPHAVQTYGDGSPLWMEGVSPLSFISDISYLDLKRFANVIVSVPENETTAEIQVVENPLQPSFLRWRKSELLIGTAFSALIARKAYLKFRHFGSSSNPPSKTGFVTQFVQQRRMGRWLRGLVGRK